MFFFLIGYAHTRSVPLQWIMLGVILTLLESSNNDWTWVAPNILLSFALIRFAWPYAQSLVERHGLIGYAILAAVLFTLLPIAGKAFDYGAEGWLWALLGLAQRMHSRQEICRSLGIIGKHYSEGRPRQCPGLSGRRGRVHLAGTSGIRFFRRATRDVHRLRRRIVTDALSVRARSEPVTATGIFRGCFALYRSAYTGDLCDRARGIRDRDQTGARARSLIRTL